MTQETDTTYPLFDEFAEQALLGTVMSSPGAVVDVFRSVAPDDWYRPKHQELAGVLGKMLKSGQGIDAVSVHGQVQAQGLGRSWDAADLFTLVQLASPAHVAAEHAKRIRALSGRRKLVQGCQRAIQRLQTPTFFEEDGDVRQTTNELRQFCEVAEQTTSVQEQPAPTPMGEFLAEPDRHDWLVPGLLERMDRIVVTGAEGGGKSVLCTQMAACLAAGVHPFSGEVMGNGDHRVRVLIVDCENSPAQSRRRYRWVIRRVDTIRERNGFDPVDWSDSMAIDIRPAGIDLLSPRDVSWLEHAISSVSPDLLVLGPLYKLHHEDPSSEPAARELAWVLDGLRERHGFALLTEAHAGKSKDIEGVRNMAPIGSSMWLRWPEFGFGLVRSKNDPGRGRAELVDVVSWRGAREEREWPDELSHGGDLTLPWRPNAEYYDMLGNH
ncbi:helicase [Gordonia phage Schmidt]|uniref:Helicase n=1 Tax=Gordonia phage Schmidt TaxID=2301697 RepID=A0A385E2N8_9CAUD|nr:helicase [Gordonia phage Schmidt]AXQ65168.1 helicase [Gordonia phage Schmidt]